VQHLAAALALTFAAAPVAPVAPVASSTPAVAVPLAAVAKPAAPVAVPAALLKKLADSEARLSHLYETGSYVVTTRFQNLDPSTGVVQKTNDIVTRMFSKDGKPWEEITLYIEAGRDITASRAAQRQKELRSGKWKRADELPFHGPFAAEDQSKYRFADGGADPQEASLRRILFSPLTPSKETSIGEASVDPEEGTVQTMTLHPAVNPNFIRKIEYSLEFAAKTESGPALSSVRVEADGGLLFVKRKVHVETVIGEYVPAAPSH
jgi:hypothetical protein